MSKLTEEKVHSIYKRYKTKAQKAYARGQYDASLKYLSIAANTAYTFNIGFKDDALEDLLTSLAQQLTQKQDSADRASNRCLFYDSFSYDNGGLVQQYLGAIIHCGYKIRYIAERDAVLSENSAIGQMLRSYGRAEIVIVPRKLSYMEKAQFVYDRIMEYAGGKLFIHTTPAAATASCAFYALPESITKFKINLTDHTFWIGTRFIDYSFEFRPYGGRVSTEQRGLQQSQILHIPFYPIMCHKEFLGFPKEAEGKVVLFSGGNYYKIFDADDSFFKLTKAILDGCPEVVLLFAGFGDVKVLKSKIAEYQLQGRFIPIGQRNDITEVFEHSDIFLNTYPLGGGLMSQYAAQLGKPIVSYYTQGITPTEELVCQTKQISISSTSFDDVVKKVKTLAKDDSLRKAYGEEIQSCVVTEEKFNKLFAKSMESLKNQMLYPTDEPLKLLKLDIKDKLAFDDKIKGLQRMLTKELGVAILWQYPSFAVDSLVYLLNDNRLFTALKNRMS